VERVPKNAITKRFSGLRTYCGEEPLHEVARNWQEAIFAYYIGGGEV
jgi:hypothetical protein